MFDIESEMISIKESILEQLILEGVDDPDIKVCFHAMRTQPTNHLLLEIRY